LKKGNQVKELVIAFGRKLSSEKLNKLVQTCGIIGAGAWALWTFWFQQYVVPMSPVALNLTVQLNENRKSIIVDKSNGRKLVAIEMTATFLNPTSRVLYILENYWQATGIEVTPQNNYAEVEEMNTINVRGRAKYQVYASDSSESLIATGALLSDKVLKPGETKTIRTVFYTPLSQFNMINVLVNIPHCTRDGMFRVEYYRDKRGEIGALYHDLTRNGEIVSAVAQDDYFNRTDYQLGVETTNVAAVLED